MKNFQYLTLILFITSVNSLVIECDYETTWAGYTCIVKSLIRSSQSDVIVTAVNGNHASRKSGDFVVAIDTRRHLTPRIFLNLNRFLPNLETILFENGMTEIHKEELAQFPNLKRLYLSNNLFQVIEPDLFINNPKLELMFMDNCKIKSVANNVFDRLNRLTYLGFQNNLCFSGHVENNRERAVYLIENIYEKCGSAISGHGSESCVSNKDFQNFKVEMKGQLEELSMKMDKLMVDTLNYVTIAKESCGSD